ncbi:hypothetical protein CIK05_06270 [Bdellovibrio sp. qaytius]|nr:hypothetical protein CIK05_06270 [Bdellovibrio sp. qaytius]
MNPRTKTNSLKTNSRRMILLAIACLFFFSCSHDNDKTINPQTVKAQGGGVDVGNMSSITAHIPSTQGLISHPASWTARVENDVLSLSNAASSTIKASKAKLDLVAPTQTSLKSYLESKNTKLIYEFTEINGLKGVRALLSDTNEGQISDIYLVSELNDFIHMESDLKNVYSGVLEGEKIISSVRIKYQGKAVENPVTKKAEIKQYLNYSLTDDCFSNNTLCTGVTVTFNYGRLEISEGRIIELGTLEEVPFDSVKTDGEYLISPKTKVSISDIYSTFSPKIQKAEKQALKTQKGKIYLIRTKNWPFEDNIFKLTIDEVLSYSAKVTFQKIITVDSVDLAAQVKLLNKNTEENEMPLSEGEVTLFNSTYSGNKNFGSFNFEYSNSGNKYITENSWDFDVSWFDKAPTIDIRDSTHLSEIAGVVPFGSKDLSTISKADFPDPNTFSNQSSLAEIGKTYGIFAHKTGSTARSVYGAVTVLDIDKDNKWMRLKFKRISVSTPEQINKFPEAKCFDTVCCEYDCPQIFWYDNDNWFLEKNLDKKTDDIKYSIKDNVTSMTMIHSIFSKKTGLVNLGNIQNYKDADYETLLKDSKLNKSITFQAGDVIAIYQETYALKSLQIIKINKLNPKYNLDFTFRHVYEIFSESKSAAEIVEKLTTVDPGP